MFSKLVVLRWFKQIRKIDIFFNSLSVREMSELKAKKVARDAKLAKDAVAKTAEDKKVN